PVRPRGVLGRDERDLAAVAALLAVAQPGRLPGRFRADPGLAPRPRRARPGARRRQRRPPLLHADPRERARLARRPARLTSAEPTSARARMEPTGARARSTRVETVP